MTKLVSRLGVSVAAVVAATLAATAVWAGLKPTPPAANATTASTTTVTTATAHPGAVAGDRELLRIADARLDQSSGLALDRSTNYLFTHMDAGQPSAKVFALDRRGRTRATITVPGVTNIDWEDLAWGTTSTGQRALFIGDIGDAWRTLHGTRREFALIRINEPQLSVASGAQTASGVVRWRLRYADNGNRNAESLAVQPTKNRIYVVDKKNRDCACTASVWVAPASLSTSNANTLTRVGEVPLREATAAAFSPDGSLFAVRDYQKVYVWRVSNGNVAAALRTAPRVRTLPQQGQGESLTFTADGRRLLVGSEGSNAAVWEVSLP